MFQYPLYRITLVIPVTQAHDRACHQVSISALSDHFGHLPSFKPYVSTSTSFNIRSIGSLWSSWDVATHASRASKFQYPLYRITLVIGAGAAAARKCECVSISALSDHFGHRLLPRGDHGAPPVSISALSDHFGHRAAGVAGAGRGGVSISALSDHFGHRILNSHEGGRFTSFNIRSIGSLWSSRTNGAAGYLSTGFQYPLYRITLVINAALLGAARGLMFQYPLYRITLVIVGGGVGRVPPTRFQYPLYRITLVIPLGTR